jgi:serine/threonine-protein kinase
MARVFRGIMLAADSPVAIKIIRREFIEAHPEIFSEIAQERRDLTSISHTNLVKVIDFVSEDDTVGVIMDLVEGPSLRTYLRQNGQLPLGDALGFLTQILLGLSGLHSGGLVHGDIKPDNILLDDSRETPILKITDFGLLGVHRAAEPGQFFGTPAYVAPEVVRTGDVQEPADIYSAGIVFYEMLAGHPPFTADSSKDLFRLKETQPLPPIPMLTDEHATTFQKDVWSVLQVLLAKNPDNRPSAFLALALVELLEPTAQDRLWMLTHAVTGERSRGEAGDKQGSAHQEPRHSVSFTSEGPVGDYVSLSIPSIRIPVSPAPPDFQNESVWSEPVFNTVTVIPPSAWPPPPPSPPPPPPPQEPVSNLDHFIPANPLAEEDIVHSSGAVRRFDCGPREFLIVDRLDG